MHQMQIVREMRALTATIHWPRLDCDGANGQRSFVSDVEAAVCPRMGQQWAQRTTIWFGAQETAGSNNNNRLAAILLRSETFGASH